MPQSKRSAKVTAVRATATGKAVPSAGSKVTVAVRGRLTPAEHARLDRIARAHAARMAAEFKDLVDVMQNVERVEPSLGGSKGGGPGGRDLAGRAGAKISGSQGATDDRRAFMPSTDLKSYMAGAASGDATVRKDPSTGVVEKTWTTNNSDGTTTVHTSAHDAHEGTSSSTHRTLSGGNETHFIRITDHRDGSSEGETRVTHRDGRSVQHTWARDPGGNLVTDYFPQTTDSRGRTVEAWDRARDRRRGLTRLPSDDAGSDLGRQLGARFSHGAKKPAPVVTHVNPGDREDTGPRAPRINLGKKIVVNPAVEAANQGREASAAQRKHWQQQLRDKIGGQVNPPGPARRKR